MNDGLTGLVAAAFTPMHPDGSLNLDLVPGMVDYLLWLSQRSVVQSDSGSSRDSLMRGYWEQVLNALVYELYFPDELHAARLRFFDLLARLELVALEKIPEEQRLLHLRGDFERLYDLQHPMRAALHDLQTLEVVRIVEGSH